MVSSTPKAPLVITELPAVRDFSALKSHLMQGFDLRHTQSGRTRPTLFDDSTGMERMVGMLLDTSNSTFKVVNPELDDVVWEMVLGVTRRVATSLLANEIVGVQPMMGPMAQIYCLRTATRAVASSVAFYKTDERVTQGDDAEAAQTKSTQLSIAIEPQTVQVQVRSLAAKYHSGPFSITEMVSVLAQEICAELDQALLTDLAGIAGDPVSTYDQGAFNGAGEFVSDAHRALAFTIMRQCNRIALATRRGRGNWAVVSPTALNIMISGGGDDFRIHRPDASFAATSAPLTATLGGLHIYCNKYWLADAAVLIGYKGSHEIDAGAMYCPYELVSPVKMIDPESMEPAIGFETRSAFFDIPPRDGAPIAGKDYFRQIAIDAGSLTFV